MQVQSWLFGQKAYQVCNATLPAVKVLSLMDGDQLQRNLDEWKAGKFELLFSQLIKFTGSDVEVQSQELALKMKLSDLYETLRDAFPG